MVLAKWGATVGSILALGLLSPPIARGVLSPSNHGHRTPRANSPGSSSAPDPLQLPEDGSAPASAALGSRSLWLEERIRAQRAIDEVYWRRRIWPDANRRPRPAFANVTSEGSIKAKVEDYLEKSSALEALYGRPIGAGQLQAELDRMGGLHQHWSGELAEDTFETFWQEQRTNFSIPSVVSSHLYTLPAVTPGNCFDDTWSLAGYGAPDPSEDSAGVLTGSEMIV